MKCTNCGKEFEGNFCPNCGKPVNDSDGSVKQQSITQKEIRDAVASGIGRGCLGTILFVIGIILSIYGLLGELF
jgi:uncharacterized membrane protein YvbJ